MKPQVELLKECCDIKDTACVRYQKRITELEEEIKNLKLTLEQMENTCKDYLNDRDTLREENRKLKEKYDGLWKIYTSEANELKEENKNLKSDLEELEEVLISVQQERDKLKERIGFLEQCLDNKEKVNISLREEIKNLKEENKKLQNDLETVVGAYFDR